MTKGPEIWPCLGCGGAVVGEHQFLWCAKCAAHLAERQISGQSINLPAALDRALLVMRARKGQAMTEGPHALIDRLRAEILWFDKHYPENMTACLLREAADQIEADAERIKELEYALRKVRGHTGYLNPMIDLLAGLLQSIARIVDAALNVRPLKPFYCASCGQEYDSRSGMYQDAKGLWQHDEEGGMSCCGPVLARERGIG